MRNSKTRLTVTVKKLSIYRDGGTVTYTDKDGIKYWVDGRIGSLNRGKVYDRYPGDIEAKILKIKLKIQS